jgi:AraC-like DNA-binding protein
MKVGRRTLQRRLHEEGLSFLSVFDDVRATKAKAYLDVNLPIAEVGSRLGFAQPAAFHKAFKRWTGMPPGAWRGRPLRAST